MPAKWLIAALLLLALVTVDDVLRDRVACIEVNHFCDDEAKPVFNQVIFWDWCDRGGCHKVCDWRLLKQSSDDSRFNAWNIETHRDYARGGYVAKWSEDSGPREVRAATFKETWTQHDPETVDRERWPQERRRKLRSK